MTARTELAKALVPTRELRGTSRSLPHSLGDSGQSWGRSKSSHSTYTPDQAYKAKRI